MKKLILYVVLLVIIASVGGLSSCHGSNPKTITIDGTIECDEINVSSKVPGRIKQLLVDEGASVNPGDPLVTLESQEIDAKLTQAEAAFASSQARVAQSSTNVQLQRFTYDDQLDGAQAMYAAHMEEVRQAEEGLSQAQANYHTQSVTYQRFQGLYKDGVVPKQTEDDYEYKYLAAKAMLGAAQAKLEQAKHGLKAAGAALSQARHSSLQVNLRQQELSAVQQQSTAAQGQVREAAALQGETRIVSPVKGYVSQKISNLGEMVSPGYPMLTIVRANDFKAKVYVDESKFGNLQIGHRVKVLIPALANAQVWGTVLRISQSADFATKRATNEQGSFDVRGLQLVIKLDDDSRFRNGMTARVVLDEQAK